MYKAKSHITNLKHLLWVWFALFALSACAVKDAVFSAANAKYAIPLNKTKTTIPASSCHYSQVQDQQISVVKQSKINKQTEPAEITANSFFVFCSISINTLYPQTTSGNSPPKYILYND